MGADMMLTSRATASQDVARLHSSSVVDVTPPLASLRRWILSIQLEDVRLAEAASST